MSNNALDEILEFHWMMDMLQTVDVGIVVLNRNFEIKVWNGFMEAHSGMLPNDVRDKTLFSLYPDISESWFRRKTKAVFELRTRAFVTWEQRPYLFKFRNFRPITGTEPFMYQNISLSALASATGAIDHICMMVYDMTDAAAAKKQLLSLQVKQHETEHSSK
ncbi:hypothetical protein [Glaciecola sp.]|jgi:beta-galactosidase/beta-glucuronidase|uniref:hypothetical protein n=1 Tax=Glaciecola sp. MF2-115 TaxID=3384827 RepID=UPI003988F9C1